MTSIAELKNQVDQLLAAASESQSGANSTELQQKLKEVKASLDVARKGLFQVGTAPTAEASASVNEVYLALTGQDGTHANKPEHFQRLYNAIEHVAKLLANGKKVQISGDRLKLAVLETLPVAADFAPVELKKAINMAKIATLAQAPNPAVAGQAFDDPSLYKSQADVLDQTALTNELRNLGGAQDNITAAKSGLKRFLLANESLNAQAINLIDGFNVADVPPDHANADVKDIQHVIFGKIVEQLTDSSNNNFGGIGKIIQEVWKARSNHTASVPCTSPEDKNRLRSLIAQNISLITDANNALKPAETAIKDLSEKVYESKRATSGRVLLPSSGKGLFGINWDKHLKPRKLINFTSGLKSSLNQIAQRVFAPTEDWSTRKQLRRAVDPIRRSEEEPKLRGLEKPVGSDLLSATEFAGNLLERFKGSPTSAYSEQDDTDLWSLFNAALLSNGYSQPQISSFERKLGAHSRQLIGEPRGKSFDDMASNRSSRGLKARVLTSLSPAKMHDTRYSSTDNLRIMFKAIQGELVRRFAGSAAEGANQRPSLEGALANIDTQVNELVDSASTPQMLARVASFAYTALQPDRAQTNIGQKLYAKVIQLDKTKPGDSGWTAQTADKDAVKNLAKQLLKLELKGVAKEAINNAERNAPDGLPVNADWTASKYNINLNGPTPTAAPAPAAAAQVMQPAIQPAVGARNDAQNLDQLGSLDDRVRQALTAVLTDLLNSGTEPVRGSQRDD